MNLPETIEPPLSPAPGGVYRPQDAGLAEGQPGSPALSGPPPLTTRLLRMGLVTLPQLSSAMAQQAGPVPAIEVGPQAEWLVVPPVDLRLAPLRR